MKRLAVALSITGLLAGCAVPAKNIDRVQAGMSRPGSRTRRNNDLEHNPSSWNQLDGLCPANQKHRQCARIQADGTARGSICLDSALAFDFAWPRGSLGSIIAIRYVLRQMETS
jgi:hypothetical protein